MKKLYFLNEEETNRILNLNENSTKRQYLGEAPMVNNTNVPNNSPEERQKNITKVYCGLKNGVITAGRYKDVKWEDYVKEWTVLPKEIDIAKKSCPKTNNPQQYKQQIINKTNDTTKQIQGLLGLEQTGKMDSGLLQKINDKLNGGQQTTAK
jgi:hypothetical protein